MPNPQDKNRKHPRRHILGFAFAGVVAFFVDAAILTAGVAIGLPAELARLGSVLAAVAAAWYVNRSITFETKHPPSVLEFLNYLIAMSVGLAINFSIFVIVINISELAEKFPIVALVPATAAGMVINFVASRHLLDR